MYTHTYTYMHAHTDLQTDRQTDRQTDVHTHTHTHTHTHSGMCMHHLICALQDPFSANVYSVGFAVDGDQLGFIGGCECEA